MSPTSHQVGPARICPAIMLAVLNTLQSPLWTACETLYPETRHTLAMVLWKAVSAEVLLKEISQQMAELQEPPVNSSALEIAYWRSTHPEVNFNSPAAYHLALSQCTKQSPGRRVLEVYLTMQSSWQPVSKESMMVTEWCKADAYSCTAVHSSLRVFGLCNGHHS